MGLALCVGFRFGLPMGVCCFLLCGLAQVLSCLAPLTLVGRASTWVVLACSAVAGAVVAFLSCHFVSICLSLCVFRLAAGGAGSSRRRRSFFRCLVFEV